MPLHFNRKFEFVGFEPNDFLVVRAINKLGRILGESPSDSSGQAVLRKTAKGFEGRIQIRSAVGNFVAEFIGDDPGKVIDRLSRKMRSQLRVWRRARFVV